jgi:hypothetical protein
MSKGQNGTAARPLLPAVVQNDLNEGVMRISRYNNVY